MYQSSQDPFYDTTPTPSVATFGPLTLRTLDKASDHESPKAVEMALTQQERALIHLSECVSELMTRLEPVLRPAPEESEVDSSESSNAVTPLVGGIDRNTYMVTSLASSLTKMLSRLEL